MLLLLELEISLFLLRRLLGVKTEDKKQTKVAKLVKGELLLINIGSTSTGGRVLSVRADLAKIQLTSPACTEIGEKVALSRRIEKHWRLVGELPLRRLSLFPSFALRTYRLLRLGKCTTWDCIRSRLASCYNNASVSFFLCPRESLDGISIIAKIRAYRVVMMMNLGRGLGTDCKCSLSLCLYYLRYYDLRSYRPPFYSRRSMRSSSAKSIPEKDLLLIRRFSSSFLASRKWRILSPSFTYTARF